MTGLRRTRRQGLGEASPGRSAAPHADLVSRALRRVHRQAFPRQAASAPRLHARLHLDQAQAAGCRPGPKVPRRSAQRKKRPRRPFRGMLRIGRVGDHGAAESRELDRDDCEPGLEFGLDVQAAAGVRPDLAALEAVYWSAISSGYPSDVKSTTALRTPRTPLSPPPRSILPCSDNDHRSPRSPSGHPRMERVRQPS
jgi:hypothetical protein